MLPSQFVRCVDRHLRKTIDYIQDVKNLGGMGPLEGNGAHGVRIPRGVERTCANAS